MSKLINLVGQRFGFWVVKHRGPNNKSNQIQWMCLCECGTKSLVSSNSLRTGNSTSCGCNNTPNLLNRTFGELTVIQLDRSKGHDRRYWMCSCSCGENIILNTNQLCNKNITRCKNHLSNINDKKLINVEVSKNESEVIVIYLHHLLKSANERSSLIYQKLIDKLDFPKEN